MLKAMHLFPEIILDVLKTYFEKYGFVKLNIIIKDACLFHPEDELFRRINIFFPNTSHKRLVVVTINQFSCDVKHLKPNLYFCSREYK